MDNTLRVLLAVPALFFLLMGVGWIVAPSSVAAQLGMPLLDGVGRSTQIGDLAAFFLTLGSCMSIALISAVRTWFYPAIMLLGWAAVVRTLAWLLHDATLAMDMIAFEAVIAALLLFASRRLAK